MESKKSPIERDIELRQQGVETSLFADEKGLRPSLPREPRFLYHVMYAKGLPLMCLGAAYERVGTDMTELVIRATAVSVSEKKVMSMLKRKLRKQGLI